MAVCSACVMMANSARVSGKLLVLPATIAALAMSACGGGGDGNGSGGSANSVRSTLPAVADFAIVTDVVDLDLNNDGLQDLLLFRTSDSPFYAGLYIQALVNNGGRSFSDQTSVYFPDMGTDWKWVDKAYLRDLNGDSLLDIVLHVDQGRAGLPPLIRIANGGFEVSSNPVLRANPGGMVPIDADADSDVDILVRNTENFGSDTQVQKWTLLLNTTTSADSLQFQSLGVVSNGAYVGVDYPAFAYAPAVLDLNNDGFDDLVYGGPKWKNDGFIDERAPLIAYLNQQDNTFTQSASQVFAGNVPQYTHVREMVVADFTGTGVSSILVANTGYDWAPYPGQNNAILLNAGNGTLAEDRGIASTHDYKGFTHSADAGDIDSDGDVDMVYTDLLGDDVGAQMSVRILANDGAGNFSLKAFFATKSDGWTSTKLTDLDNDGYAELVLGAMDSGSESFVVWNDGKGNY